MFSGVLPIPDLEAPADGYVSVWTKAVGRPVWKAVTGAMIGGLTAGLVVFGSATGGLTQDAGLSYVGGSLGVAGVSSAAAMVRVGSSNPLTGISQLGVHAEFTASSGATSNARGFYGRVSSAAAAYTMGEATGFFAAQHSAGAGSTITRAFGYVSLSQNAGSTGNYGFAHTASPTSATAGNYFLYDDVGYQSKVSGVWTHTDTTDASSTTAASAVFAGGIASAKSVVIGAGLSIGASATAPSSGVIFVSRSSGANVSLQTAGVTQGQLRVTGSNTIAIADSGGNAQFSVNTGTGSAAAVAGLDTGTSSWDQTNPASSLVLGRSGTTALSNTTCAFVGWLDATHALNGSGTNGELGLISRPVAGISFVTNNAIRGRITTGGNWIIGGTTDDGSNSVQVTGTIIVSSTIRSGLNSGVGAFAINGAAGNDRELNFQTASSNRWRFRCTSTLESGANAGSDIQVLARSDTGTAIDVPWSITRAAGGSVTLARPTSITDSTASSSTTTGALVVAGGAGIGGALWVGGTCNFAGTITATNSSLTTAGTLTLANGTSGAGALVLNDTSVAGGNERTISFLNTTSAAKFNFKIGANLITNNALSIARSTTAGGSTYSEAIGVAGSTGAVTIAAATAANSLSVSGATGQYCAVFNGFNGSGVSFGPNINAGSNSSDLSMIVADRSGSNLYLTVRGDGNIALMGTGSYGGGVKCVFIANATTAPTTSITGGGALFVSAGALKYIGSAGTITTLAAA